MATTAQAIQILTTLEYLGKYNGVPYFGVVLQTGVGDMPRGTLDLTTTDVKNILEPWMWWDPAKPQPADQPDIKKPLNILPPKIDLWWATPAAPVPQLITSNPDPVLLTIDRSITTQLDEDCATAIKPVNGVRNLGWSDPQSQKSDKNDPVTRRADDRSVLPWPAHLAQVTRYPYPIPHLLNLSFLLKAVGFDVATFIDPVTNKATAYDPATYFFATVSFNAKVGANTVAYAPPDPVKDKAKFTAPVNSRLVIPLINPADLNDNSVAVSTQPLTLPLRSPAKVVVADPTAYTAETADWQAHFSSSVASTFDLSARLVDTVRQACDKAAGPLPDPKDSASKQAHDNDNALRNAVAREFTGFVTAVLTAQREIVAYGCQTGPNGKSLLDRLLDAWVGEPGPPKRDFSKAFSEAVMGQRASDLADNPGAFDTWLALLKSRAAFATNPLLPPSPAGSNKIAAFNGTVSGKAGDVVIYNGRSFTAFTNFSAGSPLSTPTWRCLTPLLPFYTDRKLYKIGDRVLDGNTVYQAIADPVDPATPQAAPPSTEAWKALSPFTPDVDPAKLADRLIAVEHLQLQFTQPDILAQILIAQWTSVFNAKPAIGNTQFQSFLTSASANLAVWDVRGLLLQCHLNGGPTGSWTNISKKTSTRKVLRQTINDELATRLVDGLLKKLPSVAGTPPDFTDQLRKQVDAWLAPRLQIMVPDIVPKPSRGGPASSGPAVQPTRSAQGLSVMLGSLDANGGNANDPSDSLRSIAGYCVLMRPVGSTDWRCLNAGKPIAQVANSSVPPGQPVPAVPAVAGLTDPIVIPLPMHNQDGLRRAILTYNNQPLMCASPAHAFGDGLVSAPPRPASRNFDRMISFEHLSVSQDLKNAPQWKIPGLAFKQSYEFLLGAVSNSGAFPPEFADPANPGLFKFDRVNPKTVNGAPPPLVASITPVPYLRTVPVGDLRFASDYYSTPQSNTPKAPDPEKAGTFDKMRLPPIPDDVQPRANEVYLSSVKPAAQGQTQTQPPVGTAPGKPSKPLMVLSPYQTNKSYVEFDLWIRKPTTDFLTWDRTQAALSAAASTPAIKNQIHLSRQWAWQMFNTNARKQNSNFDLSLEDPAIDSLTISVFDDAKLEKSYDSIKWTDAFIQDPAAKPTPTALQSGRDPILLKIVTHTAYTAIELIPPATGAPAVYTLKVPPGYLRKVTLTVNPRSDLKGQFAAGILSSPSPYDLLVETASSAFPQQDDLKNALSIQPPLAAADPVTFTLTKPKSPLIATQASKDLATAWKQISRVDLQAQLWRWDGRPARSFPFGQATTVDYSPTDPLLRWELETFATRTASDSSTRPMVRRDYNFVANEDRGTELGATFYRAGITAYNRYGSLVPTEARSVNSLNAFASIPGAEGNWVRRFIPGRYALDGSKPTTYKPPKPAIKYIVPLTAAYGGSKQAASSVLVVVQGPWFAIAGLAEDISVEIVDVDPKTHPDGNKWKEAGPDPIYYKSGSDLPKSYDSYGSPFTEPDAKNPLFHGPVGHTFDSSDTNPLWVTSSFVLDPPQEYSDDAKKSPIGATQEGTFAQIQFRRTIHTAGMAVADANRKLIPDTPDPNPPYPYPNRSSDPTDPVWVQFLPSHFLPTGPSQDFDTLVVKPDKTTVGIFDQTGSLIQLTHNLNPESTKPSEYRFALLLTENVPDLLGRRGQERYVDMLLQAAKANPTAQWTYDPKKSKVNPDRNLQTLIARIVVIQRQVNTSALCNKPLVAVPCPYSDIADADALWQEMFPPDTAQDAMCRIVAVSPPIPAYNPASLPMSCITDATTFDTQTAAGHGD